MGVSERQIDLHIASAHSARYLDTCETHIGAERVGLDSMGDKALNTKKLSARDTLQISAPDGMSGNVRTKSPAFVNCTTSCAARLATKM